MISNIQKILTKQLASPNIKQRLKAHKVLSSHLSKIDTLNPTDCLYLWKAIFYTFWMSDKPKIQRELAARLCMTLRLLPLHNQIVWIGACIETMIREWALLDHNRLNKFLLFIRILQAEIFYTMASHDWEKTVVDNMNDCLKTKGMLSVRNSNESCGVQLQYIETFLNELRATHKSMSDKNKEKPAFEILIGVFEPIIELTFLCENKAVLAKIHNKIYKDLSQQDISLANFVQHIQARLDNTQVNTHNKKLLRQTIHILSQKATKSSPKNQDNRTFENINPNNPQNNNTHDNVDITSQEIIASLQETQNNIKQLSIQNEDLMVHTQDIITPSHDTNTHLHHTNDCTSTQTNLTNENLTFEKQFDLHTNIDDTLCNETKPFLLQKNLKDKSKKTLSTEPIKSTDEQLIKPLIKKKRKVMFDKTNENGLKKRAFTNENKTLIQTPPQKIPENKLKRSVSFDLNNIKITQFTKKSPPILVSQKSQSLLTKGTQDSLQSVLFDLSLNGPLKPSIKPFNNTNKLVR